MTKYQNAIVVGGSSGIGEELVKQLAASGCRVAALGRNLDGLNALASTSANVLPFKHDVKDYDAIPALFQEITQKLGGLDLIIYSSGVMPPIGEEEYDFA